MIALCKQYNYCYDGLFLQHQFVNLLYKKKDTSYMRKVPYVEIGTTMRSRTVIIT